MNLDKWQQVNTHSNATCKGFVGSILGSGNGLFSSLNISMLKPLPQDLDQ
ncbi:hypothetical protein [Rivularia sp. UHCC 0363]|nr:hypothetical protein [Rivularia sp. UHCC 0363]MEA5594633.1 hypothetical protein [Rivularia sp. UHCC 0363]